jgi:hypothetical protein
MTTSSSASPTTHKKPTFYINASSLKISSCFRRFFWQVTQGYSDRTTSVDIVFGWGFHKFAQILDEEADPETGAYEHLIPKALQAAIAYYDNTPNIYYKKHKMYLTKDYLIKVCMHYALVQKKAENKLFTVARKDDGTAMTELKFVVPCYSCEDFDVMFAGTMDRIVKFRNGEHYAIRDYKTTAVYDEDEYLNNYILSPQLYFYVYCVKQLAALLEACGQPNNIYSHVVSRPLSCIVDGIFLKGKDKEAIFKSSRPFLFKEDQLALFEVQLGKTVDRFVQTLQSVAARAKGSSQSFEDGLEDALLDYAPAEGVLNGACQTVYGMCKFAVPCGMPDDIATRGMLKNNFVKKPYNPVEVEV